MKRFLAFCDAHAAACCALFDPGLSLFLFYLFRRALQCLCGALLFDFLAHAGASAVLSGTVRMVLIFCVTSSPMCPSPRVAPSKSFPSR